MRLEITGRQVEVTPSLRQLIDRRLARLDRVLNDSVVSAQVILSKEKYRHRAEIVLHARGDHRMRGLGEGNAWPISLRQAGEKLEQQAKKLKSKWHERKRRANSGARVVQTPAEETPTNNRRVGTRFALRGQTDVGRGRGPARRGRHRDVRRLPQRGHRSGQHLVSSQGRQPRIDRAGLIRRMRIQT